MLNLDYLIRAKLDLADLRRYKPESPLDWALKQRRLYSKDRLLARSH